MLSHSPSLLYSFLKVIVRINILGQRMKGFFLWFPCMARDWYFDISQITIIIPHISWCRKDWFLLQVIFMFILKFIITEVATSFSFGLLSNFSTVDCHLQLLMWAWGNFLLGWVGKSTIKDSKGRRHSRRRSLGCSCLEQKCFLWSAQVRWVRLRCHWLAGLPGRISKSPQWHGSVTLHDEPLLCVYLCSSCHSLYCREGWASAEGSGDF